MINYNKICVFDFETDGSDPKVCSPVQIAAVIIDPIKLEIVPNLIFSLSQKFWPMTKTILILQTY